MEALLLSVGTLLWMTRSCKRHEEIWSKDGWTRGIRTKAEEDTNCTHILVSSWDGMREPGLGKSFLGHTVFYYSIQLPKKFERWGMMVDAPVWPKGLSNTKGRHPLKTCPFSFVRAL